MPNGDLIAGGFFTTAGGVPTQRIARWDGSSWSALGVGLYISTRALAVLPNGDLVAGGPLSSAGGAPVNGIARWDGATWSTLGSGMSGYVYALAILPNGDLVAGGLFMTAGGITANNIARWDGTTWSALGSGTNEQIRALAVQPDGQLFVGGDFTIAGGQVSAHIARYATPCVASVTLSGAACASSGGANTYTALTRPWTGSTYRTQGTGLPALAIVAVVHGFAGTAIPLASLLPPAPAGCTLWAAPDVVDATLALGGTVDAQLGLPNTPSLSGLILHQQLVALEFDAGGSFVQTTSTNGLVATVGTF
jgi:hypothetical protein